jgi:hypothetical protein
VRLAESFATLVVDPSGRVRQVESLASSADPHGLRSYRRRNALRSPEKPFAPAGIDERKRPRDCLSPHATYLLFLYSTY